MWTVELRPASARSMAAVVMLDDRHMAIGDVVRAWREDDAFMTFWSGALAGIGYPAYYWEMPPITTSVLSRPFECVVFNSASLAGVSADAAPFQEHFEADGSVVAFANLSGDTLLVAPLPIDAATDYAHLAAFVRTAPPVQSRELWRTVAEAMQAGTGPTPLWVSTAGDGVHWLHVRIGTQPRYFQSRAYVSADYWEVRQ